MIQWYPGHMKRARDEITAAMQRMDVVIELLDARLPRSSSNPVLEELRGGKPCIRLLTKNDLADPDVTGQWLRFFEAVQGVKAMDVETHDAGLRKRLPALCRSMITVPLKRPVRAMIVGIPNVGKSTLMNTLSGRKLAKVGDQPAITRHPQTTEIIPGPGGLDISDTPGILWPNLTHQTGAFRLAFSGAIRDTALNLTDVALLGVDFLRKSYGDLLAKRYKLSALPETPLAILETIGRRRGCLIKGGIVDIHKAADLLINEFRSGKIGRISLEIPGEDESDSDPPPASPQE